MIVFPREFNRFKEGVFHAVAASAGGPVRRLWAIPLSWRDFPETAARTELALGRAKRQPTSKLGRFLKRQLIRGQYNWSRRYFAKHPQALAVVWNGLTGSRMAFAMGAQDAGAARLHAELAPFPNRITLDPAGVNAESSVPSDMAVIAAWAAQDPSRSGEGWRSLGANLKARGSRRADVGQGQGDLPDEPFLFCPLQVPDDSQITCFAGWTGSMDGFLAALTQAVEALPQGWHLRLKEHPSAKTSLRVALAPLLATGRAVLDNATDSFAQIAASQGVVTLNSSMGLQAFFYDKPVLVLGRAFFAREGLVVLCQDQQSLTAAFAAAPEASFAPLARAQFMNWLDRVYYVGLTQAEGTVQLDPAAVQAKIAQAQALRAR